ncbi:MAG: CPBP family intramembrane metalloprotease, partial [Proteobacteria bacterium]
MKQDQSPVFYFSAFVIALFAALMVAALASPWIQAFIRPVRSAELHRVFSRLAEIGVLLSTWWLLRRLRLVDRELLGYGPPVGVFLRRALAGFAVGLVLMAACLVPLFLLGLRSPAPQDVQFLQSLLRQLPAALLTGVTVALLEESFFRGAMQGAMTRRGAYGLALFGVPVIYAMVHFVGRGGARVPPEAVTWESGFTVLRSYFSAFERPAEIW